MKFSTRQSVNAHLSDYCHMARAHDLAEVCEWTNGEGWDITLGNHTFQLTRGELTALTVLCNIPHPKD
jgi:hypothetical protein